MARSDRVIASLADLARAGGGPAGTGVVRSLDEPSVTGQTTAACLTATSGYAYSALAAAVSVASRLPDDVLILILAIDWTDAEREAAGEVTASVPISIAHTTAAELDHQLVFYARYYLDRFVPESVDTVIYLDGDTQAVGDLTPLARLDLEPGAVAAVLDPMVPAVAASRRLRRRITGLWDRSGIPADVRARYVNGGVFVCRRDYLATLRSEARRLLEDRPLSFHDQDVLNLCVHRIVPLSYAFNFPGFLLRSGLRDIGPRLIHFMSNPRPWDGAFWPWGAEYHRYYTSLEERFPSLERIAARMPRRRRRKYQLLQLGKRLLEGPVWRSRVFCDAVRAYERTRAV